MPCATLLMYCLYHLLLSLASAFLLPRAVSLPAVTFLDDLRCAPRFYACLISLGLGEPPGAGSKQSSVRLSDPRAPSVLRRALQVARPLRSLIRYPNSWLGAAEGVLVAYVGVGEQSQLPSPVK